MVKLLKINVKGKEIEVEPSVIRDDLEGIRDTQINGAYITDFMYGGDLIGLEKAVSSVKSALEKLATIEDELSQDHRITKNGLSELRDYSNFSATYKEEYEWWGVEPGPAKEVIYDIGGVVRKTAQELLSSYEKPAE